MLVSIIIPFYKAGRYASRIAETLSSQTYQTFEVIIIDDGCGAGIEEMRDAVARVGLGNRIIWCSTAGRTGPGNARNVGISLANGEVVAFLDSDDYWHKEYMSRMVEKLDSIDSGLVSCSAVYFLDVPSGQNFLNSVHLPQTFAYKELLQTNPFNPSAVMVKKKSLGGARFNSCGHEDLDLWIQLAQLNGVFTCIQEQLVFVARAEGSRSSNKFKAAIWQWLIVRKWCNRGVMYRFCLFLAYAVNAVLKRFVSEYRPFIVRSLISS